VEQVGTHAQRRTHVPVVDVLHVAQALLEGRRAGLGAAGIGRGAGGGVGLGYGLAGLGGSVPGGSVVAVPGRIGLEAAVNIFGGGAQVVALAGVLLGEIGAGLHHRAGELQGVLLQAVALQLEAVRALVHVVERGHAVGVGQLGAGVQLVVQRGIGLEDFQVVVHHVFFVVASAGHLVVFAAQIQRAAVRRLVAVAVHGVAGRVIGAK